MEASTSLATPGLLDFLRERETQARAHGTAYLASVSNPDTMLFWLARAARTAREAAGRKQIHVAATGVGRDQSTVNRFEKGTAWPRSADLMVKQYADDLEIDEIDIWAEALRLWHEHREEEGASARETLTQLGDDPAGQVAARPVQRPSPA